MSGTDQGGSFHDGRPGFETRHRVVVDDARDLDVPDDSVELVVTSPPYPMIELWDDLFAELDPEIADELAAGRGDRAFERMHAVLDAVWDEVARVLAPGGIACINVGDATRTLDGFRVYANHARVVDALTRRGLDPLPDILWRKPANSAAKFMGSGMLPPNAYATLEHEYVLVFRNGDRRAFEPGDRRRYESAYFWEERNEWFSDVWTDVRGIDQSLDGAARIDGSVRERSAAFPLAVPYRLVNMYSVYGDTVLDPFLGTGTTSLAALLAGRNSVGYEFDATLAARFEARAREASALAEQVIADRITAHRAFADDADLDYEAEHYDFPVRTKQERRIRFYTVERVEDIGDGIAGWHRPYGSDG